MSTLYTNRLFLNGDKVKQMYINGSKVYQLVGGTEPVPPVPYEEQYLTFEILSAGTINWSLFVGSNSDSKIIQYSKDNGRTWKSIASTTAGTSFNVAVGDKVLFKGTNPSYGKDNVFYTIYNTFSTSTAVFNVYGNIMSMIGGDDFKSLISFSSSHTFYQLFYNTNIADASNLILPATTLANRCYGLMFRGCTSLISAPELPATTLATGCYYQMFYGCTNLNYIKCLATNISASNCTNAWVNGVSSTGTFVKAAGMTGWSTGTSGIPYDWTVEDAS